MPTSRKLIVLLLLLFAAIAGAGTASARSKHHPKHHKKHHKSSATLPSMGAEPSPSIFGVDTSTFDSNHANWVKDIPLARQLGARWDRFTLGANTATGDFGTIDYEVKQARHYGMGVILSFGGISSACSESPKPANVHACPPTTASDLSNYQSYVKRILLRYHKVVQYYESWTEPNNSSSFLPGPNAAEYAGVLEAQYAAFQSFNKQYKTNLKLLFGSPIGFSITPQTSGWIAVLPYTEQVLADLHGARAFDGIALHAYRFPPATYGPSTSAYDYVGGIPAASGSAGPFPGDGCGTATWCQMTWPQELSAYEQLFENHGYGEEPLWLTEFGWPGNAVASGGYFPSEATQATYLQQAYDDLLGLPFVKGAFWFNMRDYQPGINSPDPSYYYHYGLLEYDFSPKPAGTEFKAIAAAHSGR